ncbi:MAG: MBL fold metallo-hydrolase [Lachnospiraceae bacterium]|nr:MBL fold metallo-hydrolase [Lachnospiraceae bacterium]
MSYEVFPMGEGTWRFEDSGVRFFLLTGTEKALLIDTGRSDGDVRSLAESLTDLPLFLLNTHADPDHIGANAQFDSCCMHPDEEAYYRSRGGKCTVIPVREGDVLDLGERPLRIIDMPGHTPGSIAVLDVNNRVLISGDPVQENGRIYMFGAHRNMENYVRSMEHLTAYMGEFDEVWPSHADIPISPNVIPKLLAGAQDVLDGKVPGVPEEMHGFPITARSLGFAVLLCERED